MARNEVQGQLWDNPGTGTPGQVEDWEVWSWFLTDTEQQSSEQSLRTFTALKPLPPFPCTFCSEEKAMTLPGFPGQKTGRNSRFYPPHKPKVVDRRRLLAGGAGTVNPACSQSLLNSANKNKRVSARLLQEAVKGDTVSLIPCCHSLNTSSGLLIFTPSSGGHQATSWEVLTMAEDGRRCRRSA